MILGCPPRVAPPIGKPLDQRTAVGIVNRNIEGITETLHATGTADGYFTTPDGARRSYSLRAILFFLPPRYLRFDMRSMGNSELLVGSNDTLYWIRTTRGESRYACRRHDSSDPVMLQDLPIDPGQLIESLGLTTIPIRREGERVDPPIQRIVDDYQQLLFIVRDDAGRTVIEKEYWLDRRTPRLIRRVIFRDAEGSLEMEARLDEYAPLIGTDLILPGRVSVHWPSSGSKMDFRISKWRLEPTVTPTGPQFTPPHQRGLRFDHEDIEE